MTPEVLRCALEPLGAEAVRRLGDRLDLKRAERSARLDMVAWSFHREIDRVVAELRREDLYRCLDRWIGSVGGREFALTGVAQARVGDLRNVAQSVWGRGWTPGHDDEEVIGGTGICAYFLEDPDGAGMLDPSQQEIEEDAQEEQSLGLFSREVVPVQPLGSAGPPGGLAPFQQHAVSEVYRGLCSGRRRALLHLPTGGGKTRTSIHLLYEQFIAQGSKVLWVTHRIDLLDQVHEEIRDAGHPAARREGGVTISRIQGGYIDPGGDFVLASSMALVRNPRVVEGLHRDSDLRVIVYDEAHRMIAPATWRVVARLLESPSRSLLALTATPYRTDPKETALLQKVVGPAAYSMSFSELVRIRFLAIPIQYKLKLDSTRAFKLDTSDVTEARAKGDLSRSVLRALALHRGRDEEIVRMWKAAQTRFGKTIAFACDIAHADRLSQAFQHVGVFADSIHSSKTPEERRRILENFRANRLKVLVNVGILTEGTNVPDTMTVLLARPTLSLSLYMQMIGRGARGPSAVPGKTHFYIIDCVDNFDRHGLVTADVEAARIFAELAHEVEESANPDAPPVVPEVERPTGRPTLTDQALADAVLHLLSRGPRALEVTPWGELRWGEGDAAAVFVETRVLLDEAITALRLARETSNFEHALAHGHQLDVDGALRADRWEKVVRWSRSTGAMPEMVEASTERTREVIRIAKDADGLIRRHSAWTQAQWVAFLQGDAGWAAYLEPLFGDTATCSASLYREALARAGGAAPDPMSMSTVAEQVDGRDYASDAQDFCLLAHALSWIDGESHESEAKAVEVACGELFGIAPLTLPPSHGVTVNALREAAARLCAGVTAARCAHVMHHLTELVVADGRVDERERGLLAIIAPYFGVSGTDLERSLASFCPPPDHPNGDQVVVACVRCRTRWPRGSRFCGNCGEPMAVESAGRPVAKASPTPGRGERSAEDQEEYGKGEPSGAEERSVEGTRAAEGGAAKAAPTEDTADARSQGEAFESGIEAERWLRQQIERTFGPGALLRLRSGSLGGRPDFIIGIAEHPGREFHIELKCVTTRPGQIHWSSAQVALAQELSGDRRMVYRLVIATPCENGYELHWCNDPLSAFEGKPSRAEVTDSYSVPFVSHSQDPWRCVLPTPRPDGSVAMRFAIPLENEHYQRMRKTSVLDGLLRPVEEWMHQVRAGW